ncbi:DUF3622 domain-containing protein [Shewanella eurypsychrophilus]|uniref:DUF3622 domain-containing protein n=1 Tax=Shewanella eurypsychrophilus TaxID=2593656 RepID=A0ABX6VCF7_9GAMM|nr:MULTISPECIES: DUF3622 domain-containing protein [Shewanella]QFU24386.1 DUF3622 domain-containing protein [Shewanella sp. YLB-09]QPG59586.1 DUF3622 domain-containing protein [Shewanella eurypsychrophilus]
MTQTKKFDFRIKQDKDVWAAEITRRQTARKTVVSKRKTGFATEAEATAWGEKELKSYLDNLMERNERKAKQREERTEAAAAKEQAADAWREARDVADGESEGSDSFDEDSDDYASDK